MTYHHLKCWPDFMEPVIRGVKRFEVRRNDRTPPFAVGDTLILEEWDPLSEAYTGREWKVRVTYITSFGQPDGQVVMSIEPTT